MGEVIQFPAPNEITSSIFVVCSDRVDNEVCRTKTVKGARSIARIMSEEWPDLTFTVFDDTDREVFRVSQDEETSV